MIANVVGSLMYKQFFDIKRGNVKSTTFNLALVIEKSASDMSAFPAYNSPIAPDHVFSFEFHIPYSFAFETKLKLKLSVTHSSLNILPNMPSNSPLSFNLMNGES